MGVGFSSTKVNATEEASSFITQQFSGTCDVVCQNNIDNVSVTLIGSNVGGSVQLAQTCSSNPTCVIGSSFGATSDTLLKAVNSANAKNASSWFGANMDKTKLNNLLSIRQNISQSSNQTCNIGSYNQMDDISILAVNSNIGGNIGLYQSGSANGSCQLTNSITAATAATGMSNNTATSGKDKLGQKKGSKSGKLSIISYIILAIVVVVVIVIVGRMISGGSKSKESAAEVAKLTAAKMAAGCIDGAQPLIDPATGQPLVNPRTHGPYCPPPKITTKPQEINLTIKRGDADVFTPATSRSTRTSSSRRSSSKASVKSTPPTLASSVVPVEEVQ